MYYETKLPSRADTTVGLLGTTLTVAYPTPSQKDYYDNSPRELSSVSTYIRVSLTIFPLQEASPPKLLLRPRDSTHARPWGILRSLATHIVSPEGIGPLSSRPRPESNRETQAGNSHPWGIINHAYGSRTPHRAQKDYYDNSPRELSSVSTYIRVSLTSALKIYGHLAGYMACRHRDITLYTN